jgi:hypothetical protein
MKTKLIIVLFWAFSFNQLFANGKSPSSPVLNKQLKKMDYPDFGRESKLEGMVLVEFTITETGAVNINAINSSDENLESYVRQKLESLQINDLRAQGTHHVKFNFKYVDL